MTSLAERGLARDVKVAQTIREKPIYLALQNEVDNESNLIYEDETESRQDLLAVAAPYFTSLLIMFTVAQEYNIVVAKYPLWVENVFTRNTIKTNLVYMEYMTGSHIWSTNHYDNPYFNFFCEKLHLDFSKILIACEIIPADLETLKLIVQTVSIENQYNISEIGFKFGYTMDDEGSDKVY